MDTRRDTNILAKVPLAIIAALTLLGALLGFLMGGSTTNRYSATTTQYLTIEGAKSPDQLVAMNNLLTARSSSYPGLVTSSAVLQPAITQLKLDTTPGELSSMISAEISPETLLMSITASADTPQKAVDLVNAVSRSTEQYIPKVEDFATVGANVGVVEVDKASLPSAPNSPNPLVTALVGAGLGCLLGYLVVSFLAGRRLRRTERETEVAPAGATSLGNTAPQRVL